MVFRRISQKKAAFVIEKMFIDTCIKDLSIRVGSAERGISFGADSVKAKLCIDFLLNLNKDARNLIIALKRSKS
jgi:hypothetical protein